MKKVIVSFFLVWVLSYGATAQTTFKTALEYNNYIIDEQNKIGQLIVRFNDLVATSNNAEARKLLTGEMATQARASLRSISQMPAYNGDTKFRGAAVDLFSFYMVCFEKQYLQLLNIVTKEGDITTEDLDTIQKVQKEVEETEKKYDDAFSEAQNAFAKKNNITLNK